MGQFTLAFSWLQNLLFCFSNQLCEIEARLYQAESDFLVNAIFVKISRCFQHKLENYDIVWRRYDIVCFSLSDSHAVNMVPSGFMHSS